ncbi:hypothetical protein KAFR_0C02400 [Kazachstania africana CBS 2517]|uniref:Translation initiation factor IF-2, mitochondrial n=1 Tax=Kazachstania africana (strain ATCC 22294 / BCRC 22015 / CBS 2517 / CECT 1963 / NBRC 1671 / NRRL Y-8276) TaxID=1071382 RepID=H2AS83_KAZAF|nr:hypothetical protein KAFR_0C02400 [Kazachstania africana CBS 2517]CCF57233.1 hypothetical protein KAFR_0C02400 [Kazachstania africana CBS 2517]
MLRRAITTQSNKKLTSLGCTSRYFPLSSQQTLFTQYSLNRCYAKSHRNDRNIRSNKELKMVNFVVPEYISIDKLSNLLNCRIQTLMKDMLNLGLRNINPSYILSKEYVNLILQEYNYQVPSRTYTTADTLYNDLKQPVNPQNLTTRPPIVTIIGHVDHGKTTILDYLRQSQNRITEQEHGGITQHIGAFQVVTPKSKKTITFLDTPGHEAFLKMRERGATVTDIVVLVISIEDSIMPQTIEAIHHIKKSGNQVIVAITKIDKIPTLKEREAKLDRILNELLNHGIVAEKFGGDTQVVPISAKTGENMDLLEESIVLLSSIMEIKCENAKNTSVEGWIIESKVKANVGNVATILVKKGTLKKGNILLCGNTFCKVKSILSNSSKLVMQGMPSEAVEIIGWKNLPQVGEEVLQVRNEATAKKYIAKRLHLLEVERKASEVKKINESRSPDQNKKVSQVEDGEEDVPVDETKGPKSINYILKADVSGSVEAIRESIEILGNNEVKCNVVSSSVGLPSESDFKMAEITESKILCFNLGTLPNDLVNKHPTVQIKYYDIIYKLIDDVIETLESNLMPIFERKFVAKADIREVFQFKQKQRMIQIAGCKVIQGQIERNSKVIIVRGEITDEPIYEGKIATLKHGKTDIQKSGKGQECGITFDNNFEAFKSGDKVLVYEETSIPRHL